MASIEPLKRRTAELEKWQEAQDLRGITVIHLPDNGRDPDIKKDRTGTIIIYDPAARQFAEFIPTFASP